MKETADALMNEQKSQFEAELKSQRETFEAKRDALQRQTDADREEKEEAMRHIRCAPV